MDAKEHTNRTMWLCSLAARTIWGAEAALLAHSFAEKQKATPFMICNIHALDFHGTCRMTVMHVWLWRHAAASGVIASAMPREAIIVSNLRDIKGR